MKLSDDRVERAMRFMAESDEPCAELKTEVERSEFKAKVVRDALIKRLEGTVADRSAEAGSHPEYVAAMNVYFDRLKQYEAMRNKRGTEALVVELYRTISANRRQGG